MPKLKPAAKIIIGILIVLALGLAAWHLFFQTDENLEAIGEPPSLIIGGTELFQGQAVEADGTLSWDADDEDEFDGLSCNNPVELKRQVNYYYAEEDIAIMDIVSNIEPIDDNEMVIGFYTAGSDSSGLDEGYYTYPQGFFRYYDSAGDIQDTVRMTVNQIIPAYTPFAIVLREATEACGLRSVTERPDRTSPLPGVNDDGWMLLTVQSCSDLDSVRSRIARYYAQSSRNEFVSVDPANLSTDCTESGFYTAWAYFKGQGAVTTERSFNVTISEVPPAGTAAYNEIVDLLARTNSISKPEAQRWLERARASRQPMIIAINLSRDVASSLNERIIRAGGQSSIDTFQRGDQIGDLDTSVRPTRVEQDVIDRVVDEDLITSVTVGSLGTTSQGIDILSPDFDAINFSVILDSDAAVRVKVAKKDDLLLELGVNVLEEDDLTERYIEIDGVSYSSAVNVNDLAGTWAAQNSWNLTQAEISTLDAGTYVMLSNAISDDGREDVDFVEFDIVKVGNPGVDANAASSSQPDEPQQDESLLSLSVNLTSLDIAAGDTLNAEVTASSPSILVMYVVDGTQFTGTCSSDTTKEEFDSVGIPIIVESPATQSNNLTLEWDGSNASPNTSDHMVLVFAGNINSYDVECVNLEVINQGANQTSSRTELESLSTLALAKAGSSATSLNALAGEVLDISVDAIVDANISVLIVGPDFTTIECTDDVALSEYESLNPDLYYPSLDYPYFDGLGGNTTGTQFDGEWNGRGLDATRGWLPVYADSSPYSVFSYVQTNDHYDIDCKEILVVE